MKKMNDRMIMYYLSGFTHGVLFILLLVFAIVQYGCAASPQPRPAQCQAQRVKVTVEPCAAVRAPELGELLNCAEWSMLGQGFCELINDIRKEDHYQALMAYGDYVATTCSLYDRRAWGY